MFVNVFFVHFTEQTIVLVRQKRVVELNQKTGIDNGPIFFPERICQRDGDSIFIRIITVDPKSARTHRCRDRQESFLDLHSGECCLEIVDVLRDRGLPAIAYRTGAVP